MKIIVKVDDTVLLDWDSDKWGHDNKDKKTDGDDDADGEQSSESRRR